MDRKLILCLTLWMLTAVITASTERRVLGAGNGGFLKKKTNSICLENFVVAIRQIAFPYSSKCPGEQCPATGKGEREWQGQSPVVRTQNLHIGHYNLFFLPRPVGSGCQQLSQPNEASKYYLGTVLPV